MVPAGLDWHSPLAGSLLRTVSPIAPFSGHIPAGIERSPRAILV
jgi:hypothetical protein